MLATDLSLKDRSTWIALLSIIAATLGNIFHTDLGPYVAPAATLAAAIVVSAVAFSKHHYAAAAAALAASVPAAAAQTQNHTWDQVRSQINSAKVLLDDVTNLVAAPRAPQPQPAVTAPQTAAVAPSAVPASPTPPEPPAAAPAAS